MRESIWYHVFLGIKVIFWRWKYRSIKSKSTLIFTLCGTRHWCCGRAACHTKRLDPDVDPVSRSWLVCQSFSQLQQRAPTSSLASGGSSVTMVTFRWGRLMLTDVFNLDLFSSTALSSRVTSVSSFLKCVRSQQQESWAFSLETPEIWVVCQLSWGAADSGSSSAQESEASGEIWRGGCQESSARPLTNWSSWRLDLKIINGLQTARPEAHKPTIIWKDFIYATLLSLKHQCTDCPERVHKLDRTSRVWITSF